MKCPVCKTECNSKKKCPECGFTDLNPVFVSREDAEAWLDLDVELYRSNYWARLKDFQIQGTTIVKYTGNEKSIIVPYGITSIYNNAFRENYFIEEVYLPDTVTEIREGAFYFSNIKYIHLNRNIKIIGEEAFYHTKLLTVTIPESCWCIKDSAFAYCYNLTSVNIPFGGEYIYANAFRGCENLDSVVLSESIKCIEPGAFAGCNNLNIFLHPNNQLYYSVDGYVIHKKNKEIVVGNIEKNIPNNKNIQIIGDSSFAGSIATNKLLTIPNNITTIGLVAFEDAEISKVIIPQSVISIDYNAFCNVKKCMFFCDAFNKPDKWEDEWCGAKRYQVFWHNQWIMIDGNPEIVLLNKDKIFATLVSYDTGWGDENENNRLKLNIRVFNNSGSDVRFIFKDFKFEYSDYRLYHHINIADETNTVITCTLDESDVETMLFENTEWFSFVTRVEDSTTGQVIAESNPIELLGFYEEDEE